MSLTTHDPIGWWIIALFWSVAFLLGMLIGMLLH